MSDTDGYNGWTNRATWAVALHVNNDQGWQERIHELVREVLAEVGEEETPEEGVRTDAEVEAAEQIKQSITELVDPAEYVETFGDISLSDWLAGPGMAARDIGDLDEVNWTELAESFIRDVREQ